MKKYISFLLMMLTYYSFSQQNDEIIQKSTYYFSIDTKGILVGDGAHFIKNKIAESHFFLIGEQHNIHEIETLVSTLIPHFKKSGYKNYVTEIGPISANKLTELKQNSLPLKSYYSKYIEQTNLPTFGFFGTKEEEKTLELLNQYNINLWGIDFENYSSYLALIDEIYKNADKGKISKELYKNVYSFIETEYRKGHNNYNPELMNHILKSQHVNQFLIAAKSDRTISLIEQFKLSLEINHQQTLGFWQPRVDNMKKNFAEYYHTQQIENREVKTFVKLGAVHIARGTSYNGHLEIGNMIYELANINQLTSFSIIMFPRYLVNSETKKVEDVIEQEDMEILHYTTPDKWTIINLGQLQELSIQNGIKLSKDILSYIEKYDAIIIPPATKYSEIIN